MVAKVAGSDSPVLQISSDERARVARVAERFSEEDLARFMQIMLRTHSDLGYKQEQRFHLELGLLKLVHAQRLLPLEELLSGEAGKSRAPGTPSRSVTSPSRVAVPAVSRPSVVSRSSSEAEAAVQQAVAIRGRPQPQERPQGGSATHLCGYGPRFATRCCGFGCRVSSDRSSDRDCGRRSTGRGRATIG
jgi:DNA polymerase-3 subunit gamma/tau